MSIVLTRSPLEPIGMNGAGMPKRRSARLSNEGVEEYEPPAKKSRVNGVETTTVSTKVQDGDSNSVVKKRPRKFYDEEVEGFTFKKVSKKAKEGKPPVVRNSIAERQPTPPNPSVRPAEPAAVPNGDVATRPAQKKGRRRLPSTPEREAAGKAVRRSKRLSNENVSSDPAPSPHKSAHAKSHANNEHSPSPEKARPVTVEKKRKRGANGLEEEQKIMRIALPFQDTPVIKRNKEFRKSSADGHRRSSSGMRGRRASSLIDEGRGNALPHAEVPVTEFFKHISPDLTEPRRMRCLLGWCGTRALPPKPEAPKENTAAANLEFQASQAARVIQEELSQDFITRGVLSDWFSRDETAPPQIPLRKKPNPRNIANAVKAEELERELERLKKARVEWDELMKTALAHEPFAQVASQDDQPLSPLHPDLLDSPQKAVLNQIQSQTTASVTASSVVQQKLQNITESLEFSVDLFADGVQAISTAKETAERVADRTLAQAAEILNEREKERHKVEDGDGKTMDAYDTLKALGKVMNARRR